MKRMGEGSRAAGGPVNNSERERNKVGTAVALAVVIVSAWSAPAGAQNAPLTLTVTPAEERLKRVSLEVRDAVRIIDSDDGAARANALWRMYRAVARRGDPALIKWAFELQSVVRSRKGNYLHALCWVLNEYDSGKARTFATDLARRGVAIGPNTGHYENLHHLDPRKSIPDQPPHADNRSLAYYVDAVADIKYGLSYRPEKKGQLSKFLQVTYDDGTRLDIDIRLISDSYDPANLQSLGYRYVGLGGRMYPLRMNRLSTPQLWAAKHAALAEMRRYNKAFVEFVTISTSGTMTPLGLAVPVQQPAAGAVRASAGRATNASRSTRPTTSGGPAHNAANALRLRKQLASEAGSAELRAGGGKVMAGAGTRTPIRDASRLVAEYGGKPGDWAKVTSKTHKFSDLTTIEVHGYRNVATGQVVELKTKMGAWSP